MPTPETTILDDQAVEEIAARNKIGDLVISPEIDALCATVKQLRAEREAAMKVLEPSMPESGLEDACRQLKQAYISEADNCTTLESQLEQLRAERVRLLDLVRYCRHQLHEEGLITADDLAALLEVGPESARRLESYDDLRSRLAQVEQERNDLREQLKKSRRALSQ